jgi:hypothetical protein
MSETKLEIPIDTDREQLVWERNEALAACADYRQSENLTFQKLIRVSQELDQARGACAEKDEAKPRCPNARSWS